MAETYSALVDAYDENADYSTTASVTKAKAFVVACRRLRRWAIRSEQNGASSEFSPDALAEEIASAENWLATRDTSDQSFGHTRHIDFAGFRE